MKRSTLKQTVDQAINSAFTTWAHGITRRQVDANARISYYEELKADRLADKAENPPEIEVIGIVHVADWPHVSGVFERQRVKIDTQGAEIAQLRMLLRQAKAQLDQQNELTKSAGPEYRRLARRIDVALATTTLTKGEDDE